MSETATLTSRERVTRMLERRDHDRVPRHDNYWRETIERWQKEGLDGDASDVLRFLGSDFHDLGGSWPAPFPGRHEVVSEDESTQVLLDPWGKKVRYWKGRSGTPEHLAFGCDSRETWERTFKPVYRDLVPDIDGDAVRDRYRRGREAGKWCYLTGLESFESTRALMGDEIAMMAMAEEPDWVVDVTRTYTDAVIRGLDALMETGVEPDGLWIFGDMAYRGGTMCSPRMYREIIWPDHKRLVDWAHERGMKFIYHTDGDVRGVLDLYVEAGFDMIQPLEAKARMDVRELAPQYGDRLAFFGNIDMTVAGQNDPEKLEEELRTKLEAGKAARAYAYHSDHSVPPTVSWNTYRRLMELLDQYGRYDESGGPR